MKKIVVIALVLLSQNFLLGQDSTFRFLVSRCDHVISATVIEIGPRFRFEEGIVTYKIKCVVNQSFKGSLHTNDTVNISVSEYSESLGGKLYPTTDTTSPVHLGSNYVFLLNEKRADKVMTYKPIDCFVGILPASMNLLNYLQATYRKH